MKIIVLIRLAFFVGILIIYPLLFCFCSRSPVETLCQKEMMKTRAISGNPEKVESRKGIASSITWFYYREGFSITFSASLKDYTDCQVSLDEFPPFDIKNKSDRIKHLHYLKYKIDSLQEEYNWYQDEDSNWHFGKTILWDST